MKRNIGAGLLLAVSGAFIIVGLALNQQAAVLTKAIHICLECVGLG